MSRLLTYAPYGKRDDVLFLEEMNALTKKHIEGCQEYNRLWSDWRVSDAIEDLPFLHVGLFKYLELKTTLQNAKHNRKLFSSSTSGVSSKILLDDISSGFQAESTTKIFQDFVGVEKRPLLVIDSVKSLYRRGELSARIAAAMSLKPLSSDIVFLLEDSDNPKSMKWELLVENLKQHDRLFVYGFSWVLWLCWGNQEFPKELEDAIKGKEIVFVHSGGWKKLESTSVDQDKFNRTLLDGLSPNSKVIDYYGLVEQVGIVYPLCRFNYRHVPVWADILVRDSYSLESVTGKPGQLQLINTLAHGAPYHNILTEDLAIIDSEPCDCGRSGKKFKLLGRVPKAEVRGCANV